MTKAKPTKKPAAANRKRPAITKAPESTKKAGQFQLGPYHGYMGIARYDNDEGNFFGEILGTRDVITFEATFEDLIREFQASVDCYLEHCRDTGKEPDKPFSGKFMVRIPEELHRDISTQAEGSGMSLNQFVTMALRNTIAERR